MSATFSAANQIQEVTGFLISDGIIVMQYIEGPEEPLAELKKKITLDSRHTNVATQSYTSEVKRSYPKWSLKAVKPRDRELLFSSIQDADEMAIGYRIARMIFDATFDS